MKISAGRMRQLPWLHLRERTALYPSIVDINAIPAAQLRSELRLSDGGVKRILKTRRQRPLLDLGDTVTAARLGQRDARLLSARIVGAIRDSVVLTHAAIQGEHLFSGKAWALNVQFLGPTRGAVVLASVAVRWRGRPFIIERKVSATESRKGLLRLSVSADHALPPGPVEITATLYDDQGGADARTLEAWVLPSNPLRLIVSPAAGSIYNGSVRPTWSDPNWLTQINLTSDQR